MLHAGILILKAYYLCLLGVLSRTHWQSLAVSFMMLADDGCTAEALGIYYLCKTKQAYRLPLILR
jgi:hypothetical protein